MGQPVLGFIGLGNMAKAMINQWITANQQDPYVICGSSQHPDKAQSTAEQLGFQAMHSNLEVAKQVDYLFLMIKPHVYPQVLSEIKPILEQDQVVISVAPGISLKQLEAQLVVNQPIIRTMPNTPCLVGEGMTAICWNTYVKKQDLEVVMGLFQQLGQLAVIKENLFDAFVGVAGSSPAYVFIFIEALADAAVRMGISRDDAYRFACQSVYGSAKLMQESGLHPGVLKDQVCSPKGTTIEAVFQLEKNGFRHSVIEAVSSAANKATKMTSKDQ